NFFRAPARWLFTVSFSLAILAGYGFDVLVKERERPWIATFAKAMISSTIVAVLVSPLILFVKNGEPFVYKILNLHSDTAPQAIKALVERLGHLSVPSHPNTLGWFTSLMLNPLLFFLVIGTASVLVIHLFLGKRINLLTLNAVAVILIVIDLFLSGGTNINPVRDYSFWEKRESTAFLEENVGTYRIQPGGDNPVQGLWHNLVTLYRIQSVSKTEPGLLLRRNEEFSDYLSGGPTFYDWAGVKYILTEEEMDDQSLREVYRENQFRIYENTDVLPRAFVVHHAEVAETPTAALRRLAYPDFDPLSVVVLEEEAPFHEDAITSRFQPSKAQIVSYTPNQVIIEATTDHDGYLFLSDTWYPGWKAYVDGREEKIYRANYVFRAVPIQEGRHLVEFVYDPLSFKIGVIISLLTLSLLFTLIIFKPKILQP
ncbi:MAG: YfhO family protein, partial [Anaerolineae bacterium]